MTTEVTAAPELALNPQDRIIVVGAAGFTAGQLYLRNLREMGVPEEQIALVELEEKVAAAQERSPGSDAYASLDDALADIWDQGLEVPAIFIASSTGAHADNLRQIVSAADAGLIDLVRTKVWCEKPITAPEIFGEVQALAADHPELDVSVGYILRFSETLVALQDHLTQNDLTVTGLGWIYGKDRRGDSRPTQGVFPDEIVHPLSVTDLVLARAFGEAIGVDVQTAEIQRRPFADTDVQGKAHAANPAIPLDPTSDVSTRLEYSFNADGTVTKIPVSIETSFLMEQNSRQVRVAVDGPNGPDVLVVDFDVKRTVDGRAEYVDRLTTQRGDVLFEWNGDKSRAQISEFLRGVLAAERGAPSDKLTSLEGEVGIQATLGKIGQAALSSTVE